jgi:hypothetical protein
MKRFFKSFDNHADYDYIEALLTDTLIPVTPRIGFVQSLFSRMQNTSTLVVEDDEHDWSDIGILILASILGGIFIFIANTRIIITFLGALGILQYIRQKNTPKTA